MPPGEGENAHQRALDDVGAGPGGEVAGTDEVEEAVGGGRPGIEQPVLQRAQHALPAAVLPCTAGEML